VDFFATIAWLLALSSMKVVAPLTTAAAVVEGLKGLHWGSSLSRSNSAKESQKKNKTTKRAWEQATSLGVQIFFCSCEFNMTLASREH